MRVADGRAVFGSQHGQRGAHIAAAVVLQRAVRVHDDPLRTCISQWVVEIKDAIECTGSPHFVVVTTDNGAVVHISGTPNCRIPRTGPINIPGAVCQRASVIVVTHQPAATVRQRIRSIGVIDCSGVQTNKTASSP